jgi:hypothetical protein
MLETQSFLEYVRLKTFGKNGLQQMQVDVYLMKMVLPTLADNSERQARRFAPFPF